MRVSNPDRFSCESIAHNFESTALKITPFAAFLYKPAILLRRAERRKPVARTIVHYAKRCGLNSPKTRLAKHVEEIFYILPTSRTAYSKLIVPRPGSRTIDIYSKIGEGLQGEHPYGENRRGVSAISWGKEGSARHRVACAKMKTKIGENRHPSGSREVGKL